MYTKQGKYYFLGETVANDDDFWGIMKEDTLTALRKLPDNLYDCVVTSPPYYKNINYDVEGQCGQEDTVEEYLEYQTFVAEELLRIAKPGANLFWVIRDSNNGVGGQGGDYKKPDGSYSFHTKGANDPKFHKKSQLLIPELTRMRFVEAGWLTISDIVWDKNDARRGAEDKVSYSYEHIYLFSKSQDHFWNPEGVLQEFSPASLKQLEKEYTGEGTFDYDLTREENPSDIKRRMIERMKNYPGARLRSVWQFSSGSQPKVELDDGRIIKGLASFPSILPEICINLGCPPAGVVLDPYCGLGTTILASLKWGRSALGIELSPVFFEAARKRIGDLYSDSEVDVESFIEYLER